MTKTKPCSLPCPKCGSEDISRTHYDKGEEVFRSFGADRGKSSKFVDRKRSYEWTAHGECIVHHCRGCQFEWDGPVLATSARTGPVLGSSRPSRTKGALRG